MSLRQCVNVVASCVALGMVCLAAACSTSVEKAGGPEGADYALRQDPAAAPAEMSVMPPEASPSCTADQYETNNDATEATSIVYQSASGSEGWGRARTGWLYGSICDGDEDWFFLPTANLPFEIGDLSIRARAAGASYCPYWVIDEGDGPIEFGYDPPSGPENTIQIDVYSAGTMTLIASLSSTIGRIFLDASTYDGPLDQDLYVHVHGPSAANYSYSMSIELETEQSEDECEN